jgi:hypothetical protein
MITNYFCPVLIYRSVAEEKLAKLQQDLDEVQITRIREVDEMNQKLQVQRDRSDELTQSVGVT